MDWIVDLRLIIVKYLQQHVINVPDTVVVPGILKSLLLMQGIGQLITL